MEFDVILRPENLRMYWEGCVNSLALLLVSLCAGGLLSLPMALARVSAFDKPFCPPCLDTTGPWPR